MYRNAGWLLALFTLIAVFVIWISGHALTRDEILACLAALALSRLL